MNENNLEPRPKRKRLTDDVIIAIHKSPLSVTLLAKQYDVSRRTVYDIKNGALRKDLGLGATKKFRELKLEKLTGLPHREPEETSVTAHDIFVAEGWIE